MNRREAVGLLAVVAPVFARTKRSTIRDNFIGVWKLVSCESKDKTTGEVRYPYGAQPVGRITYDAAGRMSAQLMNPERRAVGGSPNRSSLAFIRAAPANDLRDILTGFASYFGTFDIDEFSRTVIHHVQVCLIPSWSEPTYAGRTSSPVAISSS